MAVLLIQEGQSTDVATRYHLVLNLLRVVVKGTKLRELTLNVINALSWDDVVTKPW